MLKDFNFEQWWKALSAIGGAIVVGALTVKSTLGILMGASFALFGIGQWIDRKPVTVKVTIEGLAGFKTRDEWHWKPNVLGFAFEAGGAILFILTVYLIWVVSNQIVHP